MLFVCMSACGYVCKHVRVCVCVYKCVLQVGHFACACRGAGVCTGLVCVCVCTGEGMVGYRRNSPPSDFIALTSFQTFIFLNSFI